MLRDLPPFRANEPAFMTTPTIDEVPHQNDLLDDIFGSAPSSPVRDDADAETLEAFAAQGNERSDIQRLRNTHVTNGYREGIADSKEKFIQAGFDEGYSLGAELGMKVGWCLGVLEGICRALPTGDISAIDTGSGSDATVLVKRAREDLKMQNLVTEKYFGTDGIWLYDVPGQESETTFREVAAAHPVLKMWVDTVHLTLRSYGLAAGSAVG
ncbi:Essential protein Yae1, N terminal [Oleoguttula sp. CCFEE 5521]